MCGIAGVIYDDRSRAVQPEELKRMSDTLTHRGPDDEGFFVDQNVGLAMRRLNVIDLVTGHQPISNEQGSVWIVFNEEIYNFPELRRELESKGHRFSTDTATETIVHAYETYGEDCVKKVNGKFSSRRYWEIPYTDRQTSEEDLCQELGELLQDSVRGRLLSDVTLVAFLSVGIDSSTIVCLMAPAMSRPVKTYSIGFDDPSYN